MVCMAIVVIDEAQCHENNDDWIIIECKQINGMKQLLYREFVNRTDAAVEWCGEFEKNTKSADEYKRNKANSNRTEEWKIAESTFACLRRTETSNNILIDLLSSAAEIFISLCFEISSVVLWFHTLV